MHGGVNCSILDGWWAEGYDGANGYAPYGAAADADGYVTYSNVNAVEEMVNMIAASRSYQNNVEVMNTARTLLVKTLQLGQN